MSKRVYIYINGIKTDPGNPTSWTDRAVTWTHVNTEHYAEKFEYYAGALTRRLHQHFRANSLQRMLGFYRGWEIVLVGHSNGCDIICRVLRRLEHPVKEVHLIAGACDIPEYNRDLVGSVKVYIGGEDKAMLLAKLSRRLLGWLGLGYGFLGGMNPKAARAKFGSKNVIYRPSYGHSTWFENGLLFDMTMMGVVGKEGDGK